MSESGFILQQGSVPLLISLPHIGTVIPHALRASYQEDALELADTDWHLDRMYDFASALGASTLMARLSRYVIDVNRPPRDEPMYQGVNNTELCPTRSFSGDPLYRPGQAPDEGEIARRRTLYWEPYHGALHAELERLRARHGYALLLDGHSIRSRLPWLFEGTLPDLNLGTANGTSCATGLRNTLAQTLETHPGFTHVIDGRFRGGYITRHYGRPHTGVHAVQMEMCWSCYMAEGAPYSFDESRAAPARAVLRDIARAMIGWEPAHG